MNKKCYAAIVIPMVGLLALEAVCSLPWRMVHDSPVFVYFAYLYDTYGLVPYRDIFDVNPLGTHLIHLLVGKTLGYSDRAFRIADLIVCSLILTLTALSMRMLHLRAALFGVTAFGLAYFGMGPAMSFQREYLLLLPLSGAVLAAFFADRIRAGMNSLLIGFLFGLAATIKPQAIIGLPVVVVFLVIETSGSGGFRSLWSRRAVALSALSFTGLAIPVSVMMLVLWQIGSLDAYLEIVTRYWPLYNSLTGHWYTASGLPRLIYICEETLSLGGYSWLLVPAFLGVSVALFHAGFSDREQRRVLLLVGLAASSLLGVALAGKFWAYHWVPFLYFVILLASLCFVPQQGTERGIREIAAAFVAVVALLVTLAIPEELWCVLEGRELPPPKEGRVDLITKYLKSNMRPGDTVQALDWIRGGVVQAFLLSRAKPASRFILDYPFYHHISDPYIQGLRREFVAALTASRPRFIVEYTGPGKRIIYRGPDTTTEFFELRSFLRRSYGIAFKGKGLIIYERGPDG